MFACGLGCYANSGAGAAKKLSQVVFGSVCVLLASHAAKRRQACWKSSFCSGQLRLPRIRPIDPKAFDRGPSSEPRGWPERLRSDSTPTSPGCALGALGTTALGHPGMGGGEVRCSRATTCDLLRVILQLERRG